MNKDSISKTDHQKLRDKIAKYEKSLNDWKEEYNRLDKENTKLWDLTHQHADAIDGLKEEKVHLQDKIETFRLQLENSVIFNGEKEECNLMLLKKLALKLNMSHHELGDAFIAYGLNNKNLVLNE